VDEQLWKGNLAVGNLSTQPTYGSSTAALHLTTQVEESTEADRQAELLLPLAPHYLWHKPGETAHLHRTRGEEDYA